MNDKAEFACIILQQYAKEQGIAARSTSDLSRLEEWLILQLFAKNNYRKCPKITGRDCQIAGNCNYCAMYVSGECKGCENNFEPKN